MASQDQNIDHSTIESPVQQTQAARDAISFQGSHDNNVTINNVMRLFSRSEPTQVDWDWGKRLLESKQLPEICQRLTDTLGRDHISMDVEIAEQPSWVGRSPLEADRPLQINDEDCRILDPDKMLIETFMRDDIKGKLLILGTPGAGKTTALLSLAEQLVRGALVQPQTVIPALFELSTWRDDSQSIETWLIEQLYDLHGGNRKRKIYEQWLERQILLPLLDGLDELGLEKQKKCTLRLDEFARNYPQMVVCCRLREFKTAALTLNNLRGAVCLKPLSDGQIETYLGRIHRPELWSTMQTNHALQALLETTPEGDSGLLRVPLFVKLTADVYDPKAPICSKADLLEKYIERQLSFEQRERDRRRKELEGREWAYKTVKAEPDQQQTRNSLNWIARQLQAKKTPDLLIENMQPDSDYLGNSTQIFLFRLLTGLLYGLFVGLLSGLSGGLRFGLLVALLGGFIGFLTITISNNIETSETLQWSWKRARTKLVYGLLSGLLIGLVFGVISRSLTDGLFFGLIVGLIIGTIAALSAGLKTGQDQDIKIKTVPNQGIRSTAKNAVLVGLLGGLLGGLIGLLFNTWTMGQIEKLLETLFGEMLGGVLGEFPSLLFGGLIGSLTSSLASGGGGCIEHLALRLTLSFNGYIPLNFVPFLNYCVERRLLLRVGGRYRFLHRELLDHFSGHYIERVAKLL